MTTVTFLAHSGFFLETEEACLLFDWWKGELPPLPEGKPLYVFASHHHHDHFDRRIFSLPADRFLLGADIPAEDVPEDLREKCLFLTGGQRVFLPRAAVETLPSTDEGVAFLVECGGKTIYHAGDLHWWHWEGEPDPWNPSVEENFKRFTAPLRDRQLDLAFLPIDPRQQKAEDWGFQYLLDTARVRRAFPMHQWEDFASTGRFLARCPDHTHSVVPVSREGQRWTFDD